MDSVPVAALIHSAYMPPQTPEMDIRIAGVITSPVVLSVRVKALG